MRIDVLTLFPEMFAGVLGSSILKRAAEVKLDDAGQVVRQPVVAYHVHNIRDFTTDRHQKVDRPPYGGGPGMVIQCQPVWDAVKRVQEQEPHRPAHRILMSPQGRRLDQKLLAELAGEDRLLILAGHYEGFDQRVLDRLEPITEISVGDYVLTGGELPAMVLIDGVVRLLPGALGDDESPLHESFSEALGGLLDYPHYTRPAVWDGRAVPDVLLGGHHAQIEAWRRAESVHRTRNRRPDLLNEPEGPDGASRKHS
ncbi:MAG: tRNA (guanosine(37)-N1)-methyltransferase TrmD [Phycisphaeraceae bacterium]|nr:tRNA (guanosine(37)-N1)-methyltransferase TrmD [Phycisphaeraceae bacterium]